MARRAMIAASLLGLAGMAAAGGARWPANSLLRRVARMGVRASFKSSGGNAGAVSAITSTAVPPAPNIISGPTVRSTLMPTISSCELERSIIGWTVKP